MSWPAVTTDTLPTVLAAAGIAPPEGRPLDGVDLLPLIHGERETRPPIAFESPGKWACIDGTRKIHYAGKRDAEASIGFENFAFGGTDLAEDPHEQAETSEWSGGEYARLLEHYARWRESARRSSAGEDYRAR